LTEVQSQFDAHKTVTGIDSVMLRDDLVVSQREVAQLSATLAKANAKIEFLAGESFAWSQRVCVENIVE
jgi:nucleoprotein TPR